MDFVEEEEKLLAAIPDPVVSTPTVTPAPTVTPLEKSTFNRRLAENPIPSVTPREQGEVSPFNKRLVQKKWYVELKPWQNELMKYIEPD